MLEMMVGKISLSSTRNIHWKYSPSGGCRVAGVVSDRDLTPGHLSAPLNLEQVLSIRCRLDNFTPETGFSHHIQTSSVDLRSSSSSWLGGVRLAPNCHTQNLVLRCRRVLNTEYETMTSHPYELVTSRFVHEGDELSLWFDSHLSSLLDLPFLTMANIQGGGSYSCHVCGHRESQPNPLKLHLFHCNRGDGATEPVVVGAAQVTPSPSTLRRPGESTSSSVVGGHLCFYCGKTYSRKYGLKIHLRTHTGFRPLVCSVCGRSFGDPSNLNKHVRLHDLKQKADPSYKCGDCGKVMARRRDIERHKRSQHDETYNKLINYDLTKSS